MSTTPSSPTAAATAVLLTEPGRQRLVDELVALREHHAARVATHARRRRDEDAELTTPAPDVALIERRIGHLEQVLARAVVVAEVDGETVLLGSRVVVRWDGGDEERYEIVAPGEPGRRSEQVSCEAPLGRALMGRRAGDRVVVAAPGGVVHVTLQHVEQASTPPE